MDFCLFLRFLSWDDELQAVQESSGDLADGQAAYPLPPSAFRLRRIVLVDSAAAPFLPKPGTIEVGGFRDGILTETGNRPCRTQGAKRIAGSR